jgi:putative RecB family exonuclease
MPGMPRRLFPATPSKLAAFSDCPRRYRHAYVDRPTPAKGPAWAHNSVGSGVHAALRSWWELPLPKRTPAAARQLLYGVWSTAGFRDAEQSERWRARAAGWLTDYVSGLDPADEPVGTERQVAATTERLALSGRVDRIDQRGDELVVVDYKTGRHLLSVEEVRSSLALAIYAAAASRTLRTPCRRVELHHLPTGDVQVWEHDDRTLERHLGRADDLAAECARGDAAHLSGDVGDDAFPPRPSSACSWCDFRQHCPEGRAQSEMRAPWSGLAETSTLEPRLRSGP